MKIRDLLIGAAAGIALTSAIIVPRIQEVGLVSGILSGNETVAYGPVHVTTDTLETGEVRRMMTWPGTIEAGVVDALLHDTEYQRVIRAGLLGNATYTDNETLTPHRAHAVVPVLHRPDTVFVATDGIYVHRGSWRNIR